MKDQAKPASIDLERVRRVGAELGAAWTRFSRAMRPPAREISRDRLDAAEGAGERQGQRGGGR